MLPLRLEIKKSVRASLRDFGLQLADIPSGDGDGLRIRGAQDPDACDLHCIVGGAHVGGESSVG